MVAGSSPAVGIKRLEVRINNCPKCQGSWRFTVHQALENVYECDCGVLFIMVDIEIVAIIDREYIPR